MQDAAEKYFVIKYDVVKIAEDRSKVVPKLFQSEALYQRSAQLLAYLHAV